ncbi:MAG: PAS domain S-box protein [Kofleriaceae bacterium]|nr:PAS domain S-box protein [Kofleriaceae bacterium]
MSVSVCLEAAQARTEALRSLLHGEVVLTSGADPCAADCVVLVHDPPVLDALARVVRLCGPQGVPRVAVVVVSTGNADGSLRRAALAAGAMEVVELESLTHEILSTAIAEAIERFSLLERARHASAEMSKRPGEEFALQLINNLFVFVGVLHVDGTLLSANEPPLVVAGIKIDDVRGKKFWDCYWWSYSEDVRSRVREACEQAARGEIARYDAVVRVAGDARMPIDFQVAPLRDAAGQITHLLPSAVALTERVQAENALRRSEARWNAAIESFAEGVILATEGEQVIYWNPAAREMHGFLGSDENIEPLANTPTTFELWTSDGSRQLLLEDWPMRRIKRGELVRDLELRIHRPDQGWEKVFSYSGTMLDTAAGERFILLTCRDLTELRRAEQGVRERDDLVRAIIESTPDLIFAKNREGRMLVANSATLRVVGKPAEKVLGRTDIEYHQDRTQASAIMENDRGVLERGVPETIEEVFTAASGETRVFLSTKSPLRDRQGSIAGIVGVSRDITEQRRAEEALRENEARLSLFVDHAPVALAMFDRQMRYLSASRRWIRDFGLQERELRGASHYEVFPEVPERWKAIHRRGLAGEVLQSEEDSFTRLDGTVQWLRWEVRPWRDAKGEVGGLVVFSEDITERKIRQVALAEQRRLYKTVTDNATLALFITDSRQQCVFMNPAAVQLTGFSFEEVQGRPLHAMIHHTRPDGRPYPLEECPIDRALPTRNQERGEDLFVHKDGHFYPVAFTASPIVENGKAVGTVIEVRDTTIEKEVERQLRQAVALRDEFLSVASHELRTPLTALGLQLERLKKLVVRVADGDKQKALKNLDTAIRQTDRLESLVAGLLNVSRIAEGRLQVHASRFDLRSVVEEMVDHLSALLARARCEVRVHMGHEATGAWDRERLDEALVNLLGNAIKYGQGKPIEVTVDADSDWAILSIKDHGIGISPEAKERVFGRFERAASTNYGGLGLGLFITRHIVEAHGGTIEVQSDLGEGATFTVRLPRQPQVPSARERDEVRA